MSQDDSQRKPDEPNATPEGATQRWDQLVGTARKNVDISPDPELDSTSPPDSLLAKLPALREAVRAMARTLLLRRWSWIGAAIALIAFLIVWKMLRPDPTPSTDPIIAPPTELIAPIEP